MKIDMVNNDDNLKKLALDGGVLIALAIGEKSSNAIKEEISEGRVDALASNIALMELLYIICRKFGWNIAVEKKQYLLESKMISFIETRELIEAAAKLKCNRAIAMADCFTLAIAISYSCKAIFARKELELEKEMKKTPFDVAIEFLSHE
jgi:predicted nucleic acid-binding protein